MYAVTPGIRYLTAATTTPTKMRAKPPTTTTPPPTAGSSTAMTSDRKNSANGTPIQIPALMT
jgi:hypothetical protein